MLDIQRTTTLSDWERGVHMPDAAHLARLAQALNCDWTDFFCRRD